MAQISHMAHGVSPGKELTLCTCFSSLLRSTSFRAVTSFTCRCVWHTPQGKKSNGNMPVQKTLRTTGGLGLVIWNPLTPCYIFHISGNSNLRAAASHPFSCNL